ncbi:MAG: TonB-dependent receptor [Caulobacter sp.]|nr:TonB-dependent receptor [Caulobacter sp.]
MTERASSKPNRLRYAFLTSLLSSAAVLSALPAFAADADADSPTTVGEVIVTATKRSENLQNVPVSIQALTPEVLQEHQVASFDDYAKLLPSISFQSFGPGQSQPYFRGITSGSDGLHSGPQPGTGVYLDETPVTTIANGLDIHLYDIARVEALSGPQGTLFGANSLSGTLRIITNQPSTAGFSGSFDVQATKFGSGSAGGSVEGYVNIPINDKVAIRLVGFVQHDGGYIDNVLQHRIYNLSGGGTLDTNNAQFVKKDFNDVDTYGGRAALKIELDDNWTVTPSVIYQNQTSHGNFLYNPRIGDLKTADFSPEYNKDKWYQAALTVQGKLGDWDILYSGGYFDRHVENASDYSYYSVAYNAAGYSSYVTFPDSSGGFLDPNQHFSGKDHYKKETHELRLSSPERFKLRGIGGIFYERQIDDVIANYSISGLATSPAGLAVPGADDPDDIYFTDIARIDRDFALFGELSYDLLDNLKLTIGGRYFEVNNTLDGVSGFQGATQFHRGATNYGETHKINLSWKIDPTKMVYATYSTGFRPGGANRRTTLGNPVINITPFQPDTITNYEVGWKTTWLDGKLRINGALFWELWDNVQFSLSPPGAQGVTAIFNVGYARSRGIEGDIVYHPDEHWTFSGSGTLLNAEATQTFCAAKDSLGACQTSNAFTGPYDYFVHNGDELPVQPKYKVNATVRYEFDAFGHNSFVQGSVQAQGKARSELIAGDAAVFGDLKAFATADFSGGFDWDNWTVTAFIQNAFDERGILSKNTACSISYCGAYGVNYPVKPQFFGIKVGAKFN